MKKNAKKTVNWKRFIAILFAAILVIQTVSVQKWLSVSADAAQTEGNTQSEGIESTPDEEKKEEPSEEKNADSEENTNSEEDKKDTEQTKDDNNSSEEENSSETGTNTEGQQEENPSSGDSTGSENVENNNSDESGTDKESGSSGDDSSQNTSGNDASNNTNNTEEGTNGDTGNITDQSTGEGNSENNGGSTGGNSGGSSSGTENTQQNDTGDTNSSGTGDSSTSTDPVQEETKKVTIEYKGYRINDSDICHTDTDISAKAEEKSLTFKFVIDGPDGTVLQYKLVGADEKKEDVNWSTSDDNKHFTISSDKSYAEAKTLFVRAHHAESDVSVEFADSDGHAISVDFDFAAPKVEITPNSTSERIITNENVVYTAKVTDNRDYTLYSKLVDAESEAPSFNPEEWDRQATQADEETDENGNKQISVTFNEEGKKDVYFAVVDEAGNASDVVKACSYLIDKTDPQIIATASNSAASNGFTVKISARDLESNGVSSGLNKSKSFSYTLKKDGETVNSGSGVFTIAEDGSGTAEIDYTKLKADGEHTFVATVKDAADNSADSEEITLTFDQHQPKAKIVISEDDSRKDSNGIFHYQTSALKEAEIDFEKESGNGNLKSVGIILKNALDSTKVINKKFEITENTKKVTESLQNVIGDTEAIGDGTWSIYAYAEDTAGNTIKDGDDDGLYCVKTIIVDDTKPEIQLESEEPVPLTGTEKISNADNNNVYFNNKVTVTAKLKADTVQADNEKIKWEVSSRTELQIDGNSISATREFAPTMEKGVAEALPEETFIATDLAGNKGTVVFQEQGKEKYYFDLAAPKITYTGTHKDELEIVEGKNEFSYTITIDDGSISCGIDPKSIQYAIEKISTDPAGLENDKWKQADAALDTSSGVYSFKIDAPEKGFVYIRAKDRLMNGPTFETANILVLEEEKPVITSIKIDSDEGVESKTFTGSALAEEMLMEKPAKGFTVSVEAEDVPEDSYSGLRWITYNLNRKSEDGSPIFNATKTVRFSESEPTKLEDLKKTVSISDQKLKELFGTQKDDGTYDFSIDDGIYTLTISVTDYCGNNSGEKKIVLEYDNTDPEIEVSISEAALSEYPTFHKADNSEVTVKFTEKNIEDYSIKIGTVSINKADAEQKNYVKEKDGLTTTVTIPTDDVARNTDGKKVEITASVSDTAGHTVTKLKDSEWCKYLTKESEEKASFILDKTAPVVTKIATILTPKGDEAKPADLREYDNLYYFSKDKVDVKFSIVEANYDIELIEASYEKDGSKVAEKSISPIESPKEAYTISLTKEQEGVYTNIGISGTDKAGNALRLTDGSYHEDGVNCELATENQGTVALTYGYVIDCTSPIATIVYKTDGKNKAYAYNESLVSSGPAVSAYYSGDIAPSITISETNTIDNGNDSDPLKAYSYESTSLGSLAKKRLDFSIGSGNGTWTADNTSPLTGNSYYAYYTLEGTDRAGNPLTVYEKFADGQDPNPGSNETIAKTKVEELETSGQKYTSLYLIVIDTVNPTVKMDFTPDESENSLYIYDKENLGNYGAPTSVYYNGDISPAVSITDQNQIDWERLKGRFYSGSDVNNLTNVVFTGNKDIDTNSNNTWSWDTNALTVFDKDGYYYYSIEGTDRAGNTIEIESDTIELSDTNRAKTADDTVYKGNLSISKAAKDIINNKYISNFMFVIDKTAPTLKSIQTTDLEESPEKASEPNYYNDDKTYYYNPENGMRTTFSFTERNYDKSLFNSSWSFDGQESEVKPASLTSDHDDRTYAVDFIDDGLYTEIQLHGRDKAGNYIVLEGNAKYTSGYDAAAENHSVNDQNAVELITNTSQGKETYVQICHSRILDRVKPVASITHVIPENTTGYVYGDVESKVQNKASIYANNVVATNVTVTDKYGSNTARLDGEKLIVKRAFHAPEKENEDYKESTIETWAVNNEPGGLKVDVKTDKEGHYAFSIVGTDRAGNPLTVKETLDKSNSGAKVDTKKGEYDGDLSVQADDEKTYDKNAYRSLFVLVYDKTSPVYRLTINQPKGQNLADVFDNRDGKHIVYYGSTSTEINAKYTVEDHHIDLTRILSETTSMSAKDGKSKVNNLDSLSPGWTTPGKKGTLSKDRRTDTLIEKVTVEKNNEGVYRFEIAGCDKAGNLLVPNGDQKIVDNSSTLKDVAARTVEHGSNKGQYWTERKAIDITAPSGKLTIRPRKDSSYKKNDHYIFTFDANGYNTVKYDNPFWKESSAYILVESDDQSPTYIRYDLRSQDKDKDASYKKSNPIVSGGNDGFGNDNSRGTTVNGEQVLYVEHIIVKDRAGNMRKLNSKDAYSVERSNNIYLDKTNPNVSKLTDAESPKVKITASGSFTRHEADGERYIYKPKDNDMSFNVTITDPGEQQRSSGLKEVKVVVTSGTEDITKIIKVSGNNFSERPGTPYTYKGGANGAKTGKNNLVYKIEGRIAIPTGGDAESNDIKIEVTAWDNSGNFSTPSKDGGMLKLGIDTRGPKVKVNYFDDAQPQNEKYFAGNRRVEVEVYDRNVADSEIHILTNISVPTGYSAPHGNLSGDGKGEKGNEDKWTKTLIYDQDGDFTLDLNGSDALGNPIEGPIEWNGPAPHEFTVDKTKPIINISLSSEAQPLSQNGILYYNKDVTAQITITEHNFRDSDAKIDLPVSNKRDPMPPQVSHSGFSMGSDTHNAYVPYNDDGDYSITAKYTDMAGNIAEEKVQSTFVVDKTKPKLEIERTTFRVDAQGNPLKDLKDQVYSEKNFAPLVHVDDTNYDANPALSKYEVRGEKNGVNPDTASYKIVNETQFGFDIKFDNFKVEKITDDVYSVKAIAYDKAGNFSDLEFRFSVNRFGSTYEYANANGFTKNYTRDFINRYYNKDTDEPIVIREINPVSLKTQVVELTKNNNKRTLVKDTDYKVTEDRGSKDGSRMYLYTIDPSVFTEEGVYDFIISSEDVAGNRNSTSQEVKQDGEKEKQIIDKFPIGFQVDKTVPTNRITGVKSNQTRFRQNSLTVYIYPEDAQTAVDTVKLKYAYADADSNAARRSADTAFKETLYRYYGEDEKPGTDEEDLKTYVNDSGEIEIPITLGEGSKWQLLEIITTDKAGNESIDFRAENAEQNLPDTRRSFLITTNPIIQYYNNKPLFYGSISGAVLLLLLLLFLKRKKDEEAA